MLFVITGKMKKITDTNQQIVVIVFVVVGLFVGFSLAFIYFVYYYDFCPNPGDNVPVSVGCLERFPEKYSDEHVTVVGEFVTSGGQWIVQSNNGTYEVNISGIIRGPSASFGEVPVSISFTLVNNTNISALIPGHEYRWIGVFRYTGEVFQGNGASSIRGMLLEVSKVE